MTKRIAFVGCDNVTTLDLFGPLEVFATANAMLSSDYYEPVIVNTDGRVFRGESG
jgi:transcriptional regulator GlxA family with amidase domain